MPAKFTLCRKEENTPILFTTIDEEMCVALNVRCDAEKYYKNWYSTIGLSLACGKSFQNIREDCKGYPDEKVILRIINFLDNNFTANSWHSRN